MPIQNSWLKWLTPGIGIKRWLVLLMAGILLLSVCIAVGMLRVFQAAVTGGSLFDQDLLPLLAALMFSAGIILFSMGRIAQNLLNPYRRHQQGAVIDVVYAHTRRQKGLKVVAIGGGTGLPAVLRGLKSFTSNITTVVTVADDGGSSGRLRRDMGVLPPGDLRNNIAALADDESLMTQLFQYRFKTGDMGGHAFGNLFISALAGVTGSLEAALIETARVLNIQGRVLPATMDDVHLAAEVYIPASRRVVLVHGESKISETGGRIERIMLEPPTVTAYNESVMAILEADVVVIGPGSLYTSILPNLLVKGIADALRATDAYKVYICNVATQPGETEGYTVADHVLGLEKHIGRGVFQAILANNAYPPPAPNTRTKYVMPPPEHHEILQRYEIRYTDLVDSDRPWRHDPAKLVAAILNISEKEKHGASAS